MKEILVLGAGRSSTSLIKYLIKCCEERNWKLSVGDYMIELAEEKCKGSETNVFQFDIENEDHLNKRMFNVSIVISMLPPAFHPRVARKCLDLSIPMITASYVSPEMKTLDSEAIDKNVLLLNECGLDPGIDHMSAMKIIDHIQDSGGKILSFESFTGGLLEDNKSDNPWQYKFTWNPRNVILAGQGIVKFVQKGKFKYIPYHQIFRRIEQIYIDGLGYFEGYANRDSLHYMDLYDLKDIETVYRGTLRRPGFCYSWNIFVRLGLTDDTYLMEGVETMSHREFVNSFLQYNSHDSVELKLAHYLNLEIEGPEMHRLKWLGLFENTSVGLSKGSPARILEHILKKKWTMQPDEKDMIVMWHKFEFKQGDSIREIHTSLLAIGDDSVNTAMAKTVGLPLAIAAKNILEGKILEKGVMIPTKKSIYQPILEELEEIGFEMKEQKIR